MYPFLYLCPHIKEVSMFIVMTLLVWLGLGFAHEVAANASPYSYMVKYPWIVKIHPPVMHYAISVPIISLAFELYYILRKRSNNTLVIILHVLSILVITVAVLTGYVVHKAISAIPVYVEAIHILHIHQRIGFYILAMSYAWLFLIIIYSLKPYKYLKIFSIILLILICCFVFYQSYLGGTMVYDYGLGVNVENQDWR